MARPPAFTGVSVSIADIHFGASGVSPGAGRLRQSRSANRTSTSPRTSFSQYDVSDAPPLVETSPASATR